MPLFILFQRTNETGVTFDGYLLKIQSFENQRKLSKTSGQILSQVSDISR